MYAKFIRHYTIIISYNVKKSKQRQKKTMETYLGAYLLTVNIAAFLLYGYDKFISSRKSRRVPEKTLHLLALSGGSPAALLAQHLFRHKVSKVKFQWIFWIIVLFQGGVLWYFKVI